MSGLANDFVADRAADAVIDGALQLSVVKGAGALLATPIAAAVGTVAVMAAPVLIAGAAIYAIDRLTRSEPSKSGE